MDQARRKLILALDFPSIEAALELAHSVSDLVGMFKINIQLFTSSGPSAVEKLGQLGPGIFLDLKYHDIPNTVAGAISAATTLPGVSLVNVHTLGGLAMMRAAVEARNRSNLPAGQRPRLLGVTILTSMDTAALRQVGISGRASTRVLKLAQLAQEAGMDGVVASPHEVRAVRRACGKRFLTVVPGIRPQLGGGAARNSKSSRDDQVRVATPSEAIRAGADYLVVGRPITAAPDPVSAARAILDEVAAALSRG
jgi:orotidine-5'-phosphate decarboxylase